MPNPYELICRWDRATGQYKGTAIRWADGTIQAVGDGAGEYPLTDVLEQLHVDALAEVERLTAAAATAETARTEAEQARDAAIAERDAAAEERDRLAAQIAAEAEAAKRAVPAHQLRLAIRDAGMRDAVDAFLAAQPAGSALVESWEYAPYIRRDSVLVAAAADTLGLTDEQLDRLFAAAAAIET